MGVLTIEAQLPLVVYGDSKGISESDCSEAVKVVLWMFELPEI